jgi:hypothetical protein
MRADLTGEIHTVIVNLIPDLIPEMAGKVFGVSLEFDQLTLY